MKRLRTQVDQIDHQILKLLQKRTTLSKKIGQAKQKHNAPVYVPERERELLARVTKRSNGKLPACAVTAIYREILSSSRAAQAQAPVGMLEAHAAAISPVARWCFGACDEFKTFKTWASLADSLQTGALAAAVVSGEDLTAALKKPASRTHFLSNLTVVGDLFAAQGKVEPLPRRLFIVIPRGPGVPAQVDHLLILIECKSPVNALNNLLTTMPDRPHTAQQHALRPGSSLSLVGFPKAFDGQTLTTEVLSACENLDAEISILGAYPGTETYGG